jgi:hypothetical protein
LTCGARDRTTCDEPWGHSHSKQLSFKQVSAYPSFFKACLSALLLRPVEVAGTAQHASFATLLSFRYEKYTLTPKNDGASDKTKGQDLFLEEYAGIVQQVADLNTVRLSYIARESCLPSLIIPEISSYSVCAESRGGYPGEEQGAQSSSQCRTQV